MVKKYRSKIGILPLLILFVLCVSINPFDKISNRSIVFAILLSLFFLLVYFSIQYVITENTLTIKSLGFKRKIPISEIKLIKRSYNPLSSPAYSLKRIEIKYGPQNKYVLISPQKEMDFIEELCIINPKIKVEV